MYYHMAYSQEMNNYSSGLYKIKKNTDWSGQTYAIVHNTFANNE